MAQTRVVREADPVGFSACHKPHSFNHMTSKLSQWINYTVPALLFITLLAFADHMVDIEEQRLKESKKSQVLLHASAIRAQLESELNAALHITSGLTGYVAVNPSLAGKEDVQKVLQTLFEQSHHLRNIGLAPNNILSHLYPLKGNEEALGLNYEEQPDQWPAVKRAMESRSTVMTGPIGLLQGGKGLISRTPVFLDDGSYWGVLSLVINADALVASIRQLARETDVRFALRSITEKGSEEAFFLGGREIFEQQPLLLNLSIPGGQWQLGVVPLKGWDSNLTILRYYRLGAAVIALVLASMLWVILANHRAITHIALHDPLTELPNRRLFNERLEYTLAQKQRQRAPFALISVDMNKFKPINDQYGHKAGDEVLREVGRRLQQSVRKEDTVARFGGDEFQILLPSTCSREDAELVAQKLHAELQQPFHHHGNTLEISASLGIGFYPDDGESAEALLKAADTAMYEAKHSDKGAPDRPQG